MSAFRKPDSRLPALLQEPARSLWERVGAAAAANARSGFGGRRFQPAGTRGGACIMRAASLVGVCAGMAELVDALDLGSSAARRESSSLFPRTKVLSKAPHERAPRGGAYKLPGEALKRD